jgi:pimeloyl-ACP methyl ester carboxylesterase
MMAVHHGHKKIARLLIDSGANVDACDLFGNTALFYAATGQQRDLIEPCISLLLDSGALATQKNHSDQDAQSYADTIGSHFGASTLAGALRQRKAQRIVGGKKRAQIARRANPLLPVPFLLSQPTAPKGTILVYHGLGDSKESLPLGLKELSDRGWRAIAVDAVGHGERRYPDYDDRFSEPHQEASFYQVVEQTAQEVPSLLDALGEGPFGIIGYSMGGYIGYRAATLDKRLSALCTIGSSPTWPEAYAGSPHQSPEAFFPVALLSQNGRLDEVVPAQDAHALALSLEPYYADAPDRLNHVEYPSGSHTLEERGEEVWSKVLLWLDRFVR